MIWVAKHPHHYMGKVVANGQCVRFLQVCAGVPHTSRWRRGAKVRSIPNIQPGIAAATFGSSGKYENRTDGASHACFVMDITDDGILVLDQWTGQPVHKRLIRFRGTGGGKKVNNGDMYYVIETV